MASLVLGIIGSFFTLVGLVPFLGFLNYISVILLVVGLILGIVGVAKKQGGAAIGGLIISLIFLVIAIWRLYISILFASALSAALSGL